MLSKIGWITLDNASNNDTLLYHLEKLLKERNISFDAVLRRIRSAHIAISLHITSIILCKCFPHIVNLTCKAILSAITDMDFTAEETEDYVSEGTSSDPIVTLRTPIRVVRLFNSYFDNLYMCLIDTSIFNSPPAVFTSFKTSGAARSTAPSRYGCSVVLNITNDRARSPPSNSEIYLAYRGYDIVK